MPDYSALIFEVRDQVGRITLNRPEAANSLGPTIASELMDAVLRCEEDPHIRAILVSGSGRFFCAGANLKGGDPARDSDLKSRISVFHAMLSRLARAELPVVAAVNGAAAGAGVGLACACDIIIASESARFVMAYSRIGLSPDGGTTYFLPRKIGMGRTMELIFTNRSLSASEALQWGLVNRVVADGQLAAEAHLFVAMLAAGPTKAFAAAKRLLHEGWGESLESQIDKELRMIGAMGRTADAREALAAFVAKRTPVFKGE